MKGKKIWAIIGIIVAVIAGAIMYAVANKDDMPTYSQPGTTNTAPQNSNNQNSSGAPETPPTTPGRYIDYTPEAFANTEGERWLFFHASWCPQCRALEKDIQEKGVPQGITIFKVNYDTETDLKKKYGVTLQTTVVKVDAQGDEVKKYVAYDQPTLAAVKNALE